MRLSLLHEATTTGAIAAMPSGFGGRGSKDLPSQVKRNKKEIANDTAHTGVKSDWMHKYAGKTQPPTILPSYNGPK